jgi:hypothetical protein
MNLQLLVNTADVAVYGRVGDARLLGNLLVKITLCQKSQNLLLAWRKFYSLRFDWRGLPKRIRYFAGDVAGHGRTAGENEFDRCLEFVPRCLLEQIAAGTRFQRVEHAVGVFVHGKHDELDFGLRRLELPDAFDAIHFRHVNIHEHNIGCYFGKGFQSRSAGTKSADAPAVGKQIHRLREAASEGVIVVYHCNADVHAESIGHLCQTQHSKIGGAVETSSICVDFDFTATEHLRWFGHAVRLDIAIASWSTTQSCISMAAHLMAIGMQKHAFAGLQTELSHAVS